MSRLTTMSTARIALLTLTVFALIAIPATVLLSGDETDSSPGPATKVASDKPDVAMVTIRKTTDPMEGSDNGPLAEGTRAGTSMKQFLDGEKNFSQHLIDAQHEQPVPVEVLLFENYLIEQIDRANQERGSKLRVADDLPPDGICDVDVTERRIPQMTCKVPYNTGAVDLFAALYVGDTTIGGIRAFPFSG